jgi:hypothetical protein
MHAQQARAAAPPPPLQTAAPRTTTAAKTVPVCRPSCILRSCLFVHSAAGGPADPGARSIAVVAPSREVRHDGDAEGRAAVHRLDRFDGDGRSIPLSGGWGGAKGVGVLCAGDAARRTQTKPRSLSSTQRRVDLRARCMHARYETLTRDDEETSHLDRGGALGKADLALDELVGPQLAAPHELEDRREVRRRASVAPDQLELPPES